MLPAGSAVATSDLSSALPALPLPHPATDFASEIAEAIASERQDMLERERKRTDELARELAQIRAELGALRVHGVRWGADLNTLQSLPVPSHPDPVAPEAPPEARAAAAFAVARAEPPAATSMPTNAAIPADSPQPSSEPVPSPARKPVETPTSSHQRLIDRATALIKAHDISGARLILERAVSDGSARAVYLLAQTYDPDQLRAWAVVGLRGDSAKAQELYTLAQARGVSDQPARPTAR